MQVNNLCPFIGFTGSFHRHSIDPVCPFGADWSLPLAWDLSNTISNSFNTQVMGRDSRSRSSATTSWAERGRVKIICVVEHARFNDHPWQCDCSNIISLLLYLSSALVRQQSSGQVTWYWYSHDLNRPYYIGIAFTNLQIFSVHYISYSIFHSLRLQKVSLNIQPRLFNTKKISSLREAGTTTR